MKKIMLLSVSAGAGHKRAAEAIQSSANTDFPGLDVMHLDVMDYVSPAFRKIYTDFYIKLVDKAPMLWSYLYNYANDAKPDSSLEKMRRKLERMNAKALLRKVEEFSPDAIICTHFMPAEILSRQIQKQQLHYPVWVQVTDFDLHRMWVHEGMAGYFAANEEVAFRLQARGIPAAQTHVVGIPIMPAFSQPLARATCAAEIGLNPKIDTILLMGGGAGMGSLPTLTDKLLQLHQNLQLIVLAGKNTQALATLQQLAARYPGQLFPQGFTSQVERLMICADWVITKPGGLTSSECLAMGLPMIVNSPIPGQEERNADFLLEQGVALKACDIVTLEFRVRHLLDHPATRRIMQDKARTLGRPYAARHVLEKVLHA